MVYKNNPKYCHHNYPQMFGYFRSKSQAKPITSPVSQLQKATKLNQDFIGYMQQYRNIQIKYMGQILQLQTKLRDELEQSPCPTLTQFFQLLQLIQKNHKILLTRLNTQIYDKLCLELTTLLSHQQCLANLDKIDMKKLEQKKLDIEKLKDKQCKFNKSMADQLMQEIFAHNSFKECVFKEKIVDSVQKMEEIKEENGSVLQESLNNYHTILSGIKQIYRKFDNHQDNFTSTSLQALRKTTQCLQSYSYTLSNQLQSFMSQLSNQSSKSCYYQKLVSETQKIEPTSSTYLQATLQLIKSRQLENVIAYYKNRQVKNKIKEVLETVQVAPENTDQITRQVQLFKKILKATKKQAHLSTSSSIQSQNTDPQTPNSKSQILSSCFPLTFPTRQPRQQLLHQFKLILQKNTKNRINFIFMLQQYRINNKFQINQENIQPILLLIKEVLIISARNKDSFVIKNLLILLLTYYVIEYPKPEEQDRGEGQGEGEEDEGDWQGSRGCWSSKEVEVDREDQTTQVAVGEKVYLLQYFRNWKLWRDLTLWQSILVQSIFTQKKQTIRMLLSSSSISNKTQFQNAQKTLILNQILYTIHYKQQQVKLFVNKFMKILFANSKLQPQFMQDIYVCIGTAVEETNCGKQDKDGREDKDGRDGRDKGKGVRMTKWMFLVGDGE